VPQPEPGAGQLLVHVKAAGAGNWDALIREGKVELQPLPIILGSELSGKFSKLVKHGLRKAGATRAAENGATERELNAIFGWTGNKMASLYTQTADRALLAKAAMKKLARNETGLSNRAPEISNPAPKRILSKSIC
jgi:NADPH:quinone reductase-like Zn-dependent oxidoreductase